MSRLGMSFGGESPVVLTVPGRKSGTPALDTGDADDGRRKALHRGRLSGRGLGRKTSVPQAK